MNDSVYLGEGLPDTLKKVIDQLLFVVHLTDSIQLEMLYRAMDIAYLTGKKDAEERIITNFLKESLSGK